MAWRSGSPGFPDLANRAVTWAAMARGDRNIGKVVRYGTAKRFKLDFGRRWGPHYLYSFCAGEALGEQSSPANPPGQQIGDHWES